MLSEMSFDKTDKTTLFSTETSPWPGARLTSEVVYVGVVDKMYQ